MQTAVCVRIGDSLVRSRSIKILASGRDATRHTHLRSFNMPLLSAFAEAISGAEA